MKTKNAKISKIYLKLYFFSKNFHFYIDRNFSLAKFAS